MLGEKRNVRLYGTIFLRLHFLRMIAINLIVIMTNIFLDQLLLSKMKKVSKKLLMDNRD